jgi:hypothetical protein
VLACPATAGGTSRLRIAHCPILGYCWGGTDVARITAAVVLTFLATAASSQEAVPTENDLHAAYCISGLKQDISVAHQTLNMFENAPTPPPPEAKDWATRAAEITRARLAVYQANLNRLQLYLTPKLTSLDPLAIAGATHRAEADWQAMGRGVGRCSPKCFKVPEKELAECFASCQDAALLTRIEQCRDPNLNWLPR